MASGLGSCLLLMRIPALLTMPGPATTAGAAMRRCCVCNRDRLVDNASETLGSGLLVAPVSGVPFETLPSVAGQQGTQTLRDNNGDGRVPEALQRRPAPRSTHIVTEIMMTTSDGEDTGMLEVLDGMEDGISDWTSIWSQR